MRKHDHKYTWCQRSASKYIDVHGFTVVKYTDYDFAMNTEYMPGVCLFHHSLTLRRKHTINLPEVWHVWIYYRGSWLWTLLFCRLTAMGNISSSCLFRMYMYKRVSPLDRAKVMADLFGTILHMILELYIDHVTHTFSLCTLYNDGYYTMSLPYSPSICGICECSYICVSFMHFISALFIFPIYT